MVGAVFGREPRGDWFVEITNITRLLTKNQNNPNIALTMAPSILKSVKYQLLCKCGKERRSEKHRECVLCHREFMRGYMARTRKGKPEKRRSEYSQEEYA